MFGGITMNNFKRWIYLRRSLINLGKIVEEDDKFICYVNQKKIDKYNKKHNFLISGFYTINDGIRKKVNDLNLNKSVYYIFDNIKFTNKLSFCSRSSHVIFKNCTFEEGIKIFFADDIVFQNNKYLDYNFEEHNDCFLKIKHINKLTFIDDNFANSYKHSKSFDMDVIADRLELIDTNVSTQVLSKITAKKTIIKNSELNVNKLCLNSNSIDTDHSTITAKESVEIKNEEMDFDCYIESPLIIYDNVELSEDNFSKFITNREESLDSKKLYLENLKEMVTKYQNIDNRSFEPIDSNDYFPKVKVKKI